jgi:hypothetical protein
MNRSIHAAPLIDEHAIDGLGCWCVPRYVLPCDECGDDEGLDAIVGDDDPPHAVSFAEDMRAPVPSCWKCTEGLIELTRAEAEACTRPLVIVHNR